MVLNACVEVFLLERLAFSSKPQKTYSMPPGSKMHDRGAAAADSIVCFGGVEKGVSHR